MSKSLKRVQTALTDAGIDAVILEMPGETRTAADAAREAACQIDQIAKSILFQGQVTGHVVLFITAGGNTVDPDRASALAGEPLGRADAAVVRATTGFAIGGVAPIAHKTPSPVFFDPRLLDFTEVFAAAGTPRHIFSVAPATLRDLANATTAAFTG